MQYSQGVLIRSSHLLHTAEAAHDLQSKQLNISSLLGAAYVVDSKWHAPQISQSHWHRSVSRQRCIQAQMRVHQLSCNSEELYRTNIEEV